MHGIRSWEGMQTGLVHIHVSYGQTCLSYTSLHNKRQISCCTDGRYFVVQRYLRLRGSYNSLLFRLKFPHFNGNVVKQLEAPFIFARSFAFSCSWLIRSRSRCRMVLYRSSQVFTIFLLEVMRCSISIGAVLSWLLMCSTSCSVAMRELTNSWSATAEKKGIAGQTTSLYWQGEQKSFVCSAYVAICDRWDKYSVCKCIYCVRWCLMLGIVLM